MGETNPKTCKRCKSNPATISMRQSMVCESCYADFVSYKVIKRMGGTLKDLRCLPSKSHALKPKYLLGLSFGPSSAALFHMLELNASRLEGKNPHLLFELTALHIDMDLSSPRPSEANPNPPSSPSPSSPSTTTNLVSRYRSRFPRFTVDSVPLEAALDLDTIDWSTLPRTTAEPPAAATPTGRPDHPRTRLRRLLERLPSNASRADVLRLLVRHLLLHVAMERGCDALLLGSTTTALAEVTLAETAKGRGNSVPVLISDGSYPVARLARNDRNDGNGHETTAKGGNATDVAQLAADMGNAALSSTSSFPIYFPMRDVLRREIIQYNDVPQVSMVELVSEDADSHSGSNVVSHKDLSIEDVMARYFEEVELDYPSVVTNVVRTTGRLTRPDGDACGLCGMALDEQGDARWKGEIGDDELGEDALPLPSPQRSRDKAGLCYGCQRTVRG